MGLPVLKVRRWRQGGYILTFLARGRENHCVKWILRDAPAAGDHPTPEVVTNWLSTLDDVPVPLSCERRHPHPRGGTAVYRMSSKVKSRAATVLLDIARRIVALGGVPSLELARPLGVRFVAAVVKAMQGKAARIRRVAAALEEAEAASRRAGAPDGAQQAEPGAEADGPRL